MGQTVKNRMVSSLDVQRAAKAFGAPSTSQPVSNLNQGAWMVNQGISNEYAGQRDASQQQGQAGDALARMQQQRAVQMMGNATSGQTIAERQAGIAAEGIRKGARSQLAAGGSYNPMAVRAAQMGQAQALGQLGAQTGVAAAQEQQQNMQNYLAATGQLRGADQATDQMMRNEAVQREQIGQDWQKIGLQDKAYTDSAAQDYQKMKQAREMELLSKGLALETNSYSPYYEKSTGEKVADFFGGIFSDENVKNRVESGDEAVDKMLSSGKFYSDINTKNVQGDSGSELDQVLGAIKNYAPEKIAGVANKVDKASEIGRTVVDSFKPNVGTSTSALTADGLLPLNPDGGAGQEAPSTEGKNNVMDYVKAAGSEGGAGGKLQKIPNPYAQVVGAALSAAGKGIQAFTQAPKQMSPGGRVGQEQYVDRMGTYSDENTKDKISNASLDEFFEAMNAKKFNYRDDAPVENDGQRTGVVVQDLEDSDIGDAMTFTNPENGFKMLDTAPDKFNPLVLASLSRLHDRLSKLEGGE